MGPTGDIEEDQGVGIQQGAPLGDTASPDMESLQQQGDIPPKKLDKSKRQSKHASMLPEMENPNVKRRSSKLGLFGLFNRSKISMDVETPQEKLETQWEGIVSTERPVTRDPSAAYIPPEADLMPIQEAEDASVDTKLQHQTSKGRLRNRHSFKWESKRESKEPMPIPIPLPANTWNAPPLFQVYPQSVKHSTLKAPLMSAEAILRLSKEKNANNESNSAGYGERSGSIDGKPQKEKKLKKSTALENMAKGEWVDKTYVLVTAGYLLQYAGQGNYDRIPEKILQLSEISAAFATDAIPGRPFVLQVSQALNQDGTVETEISRSMFKKMGGLRADMRRAVSNLLLVFESPEEMNEWLMAVRKEIEALGGKECNPEMPWDEPEGKGGEVEPPSPSPRYLVMRNPNQFSPKIPSPKSWESPHGMSLGARALQDDKLQEAVKSPVQSVSNRQSMATQHSRKSRYVSDTHESIDQVHLDRLRESYASTTEGTTSTSRDSSPNRSPLLDQDFISDIRAKPLSKSSTYPETVRLSRQRLSESPNTERESLQPTPTPISRPSSTIVSAASGPSSERTMSPESTMSPAPNFSVPSFSKRYSAASASPPLSAQAQSPPPITVLQGAAVSEDEEKQLNTDAGPSSVGQLQVSYTSSPLALIRHSSPQPSTTHLSSPPPSSHSHVTPPGSSEGERSYSRRFSSLEYARGISPVKTSQHSPSPHPPPNIPLPPLPSSTNSSKRTSLLPPATAPPNVPLPQLPVSRPSSQPPPAPPPTGPLPAIPTERRASSRASTPGTTRERSSTPSRSLAPSPASSSSPLPPPTSALPPVPIGARPTTPNEKRQSKRDSSRTRLHKSNPANSQTPEFSVATLSPPKSSIIYASAVVEHEEASQAPIASPAITPLEASQPSLVSSPPPHSTSSSTISSPPKPTRVAPLPPPSPPAVIAVPAPASENRNKDILARVSTVPGIDTPPTIISQPAIDQPRPILPNPTATAAAASFETSSSFARGAPTEISMPPLLSAPTAPSLPPRASPPSIVQPRRNIPRIGREPPPVFSPRIFSKTKASTISSAPPPADEPIALPKTKILAGSPISAPPSSQITDGKSRSSKSDIPHITPLPAEAPQKQGTISTSASASSPPHPFIPPIRLSHSREKGSFDGPWNAEYGHSHSYSPVLGNGNESQGPATRMVLDLGAGA